MIVTIMAISIIVALSVQFNRKMRDQLASAANIDQSIKALYIAKSGISYALALLEEDDREVDTLQDLWSSRSSITESAIENVKQIPDASNLIFDLDRKLDFKKGEKEGEMDYVKQISEDSKGIFDVGSFEISIEDLSSKIQINRLVDMDDLSGVFGRLLEVEEFQIDDERKNEIVDSLKDWIDKAGEDDDLTRLSGAEDDYYMSLENPYHCKNGPLDSVSELLLVKGMTPDLLGSNDADEFTLHRYLTVFGDDGKININTADRIILLALSEKMTENWVDELVNHREIADQSDLSGNWHKAILGTFVDDISDKIITTKSTHFKITSIGTYGDISHNKGTVKRTVTAVYRREPERKKGRGGFQVLAWKIE